MVADALRPAEAMLMARVQSRLKTIETFLNVLLKASEVLLRAASEVLLRAASEVLLRAASEVLHQPSEVLHKVLNKAPFKAPFKVMIMASPTTTRSTLLQTTLPPTRSVKQKSFKVALVYYHDDHTGILSRSPQSCSLDIAALTFVFNK